MIYFVGAGPGDPELITLRGYRLLKEAEVIVYAGSLINPQILEYASNGARFINSASLTLEEIVSVMVESYKKGETVVRLHAGDVSIYGAVGEQMYELENRGIDYEVVAGVSSFLAAAASIKKEYTVPSGSQTLIVTRLEGRTPVPKKENLASLAAHGASMAIFLSAGMMERVQEELLQSYPPETPAAVVYKISWPDEMLLKCTLKDLAKATREAGITKTALILVGDFLEKKGKSKLYDKFFTHGCREGENGG